PCSGSLRHSLRGQAPPSSWWCISIRIIAASCHKFWRGEPAYRVIQINKTEKLQANHVYVIPPDRRVELNDHEISPSEFEEPRGRRAPIDGFLRSATRTCDGFAIILSGAGSDGANGVRAVKEAGGIILVQDPQEAEYSSMPRSAIASGVADFILPVRDL